MRDNKNNIRSVTELAYLSSAHLLDNNLNVQPGVGLGGSDLYKEVKSIKVIDTDKETFDTSVNYFLDTLKRYSTFASDVIYTEAATLNTNLNDLEMFSDKYIELDFVINTNPLELILPSATDDILIGKPYIRKINGKYIIDLIKSYKLVLDGSSIFDKLSNEAKMTSTNNTSSVDSKYRTTDLVRYAETVSPMFADYVGTNTPLRHVTPIGLLMERLTPVRYGSRTGLVVTKDGSVATHSVSKTTEIVDVNSKLDGYGNINRSSTKTKTIEMDRECGYSYYTTLSSDVDLKPAYSPFISLMNSCKREYDNTFKLSDNYNTEIILPNVVFNPNTKKVFILEDSIHRYKLNNMLMQKYSTSLITEGTYSIIRELTKEIASSLNYEVKTIPTILEIAQFLGIDEDAVILYMKDDSNNIKTMIKLAIKELLKANNDIQLNRRVSLLSTLKRASANASKLIASDIVEGRTIRLSYVSTILKAYSISGFGVSYRKDIQIMRDWYLDNDMSNDFDQFNELTKARIPDWVASHQDKIEIHEIISKLFNIVKYITANGTSDKNILDDLLTEIYILTNPNNKLRLDENTTILDSIETNTGESLKSILKLDVTNLVLLIIKYTFSDTKMSFGSPDEQLDEVNTYLTAIKYLTEDLDEAQKELGEVRTNLVEVLDFDAPEEMEKLSTNEEANNMMPLKTGCIETDKLLGSEDSGEAVSTGQLLSIGGLSNMGKSTVGSRLNAGIMIAQDFKDRISGIKDTTAETLNPINLKIVEHIDNAIRSILVENIPVSFKALQMLTRIVHISAEDEITVVMNRYLTDIGRDNIFGIINRAYNRCNITLTKGDITLLSHIILVATRVDRDITKAHDTLRSIGRVNSKSRWFNPSTDVLSPILKDIVKYPNGAPELNKGKVSGYYKKLQYIILTSISVSRYVRASFERQNPTDTNVESLINYVESIAPDSTSILIDYVDKYIESDSSAADKRHIYKQLKSIAFTHDSLIIAPNQLSSAMMLDKSLEAVNLVQAIESSMREPRYQGIATLKTELDIELITYTVKQLGNNVPIRVISANKSRYGKIKAHPFITMLYNPDAIYDKATIPLDTITYDNQGKFIHTQTAMRADSLSDIDNFIPLLTVKLDEDRYCISIDKIKEAMNSLAKHASQGDSDININMKKFDNIDNVETLIQDTNLLSEEELCRATSAYVNNIFERCSSLSIPKSEKGTIVPNRLEQEEEKVFKFKYPKSSPKDKGPINKTSSFGSIASLDSVI